jgi:predicted metal-binding membrane protein
MAISRDRLIVVASLAAITGLAWAYLFAVFQDMSGMGDMPGMAMPSAPAPLLLTAIMWAVMMIGMMLPSATPMILLFTMVQRKQGTRPILTTGTFAVGSLMIGVALPSPQRAYRSSLSRWHSCHQRWLLPAKDSRD